FESKYIQVVRHHATNLAEMVIFMVKGRSIRHMDKIPASSDRPRRVLAGVDVDTTDRQRLRNEGLGTGPPRPSRVAHTHVRGTQSEPRRDRRGVEAGVSPTRTRRGSRPGR